MSVHDVDVLMWVSDVHGSMLFQVLDYWSNLKLSGAEIVPVDLIHHGHIFTNSKTD